MTKGKFTFTRWALLVCVIKFLDKTFSVTFIRLAN